MFLLQRRLVWCLLQMKEVHGETFISGNKKKNLMNWKNFPSGQAQVATGRAGTCNWNMPKTQTKVTFVASICANIKWKKKMQDNEEVHLVSRMSSDTARATQSGWRFLRSRRTRTACSSWWQDYSTSWGWIWHRFLPLWEAGRCSQLQRALRRKESKRKRLWKQSYTLHKWTFRIAKRNQHVLPAGCCWVEIFINPFYKRLNKSRHKMRRTKFWDNSVKTRCQICSAVKPLPVGQRTRRSTSLWLPLGCSFCTLGPLPILSFN